MGRPYVPICVPTERQVGLSTCVVVSQYPGRVWVALRDGRRGLAQVGYRRARVSRDGVSGRRGRFVFLPATNSDQSACGLSSPVLVAVHACELFESEAV